MRSVLLGILILMSCSCLAYDVVVTKDGSGNFTTVQAAIDAAPTGRSTPYTIFVRNGSYKEKITIPSNKPFLHLAGESVVNTILWYDDYASKYISCSATVGTQNSASFSVNAADFAASNITFQNSYGDGSQAVAVLVNADRALFINCRMLGNQDTLYLKGSGTPKCYFKQCYIDGNVDFIFGSAVALFDSCVIYAKTRPTTTSSYITAANTPTGQAYGFVFRDCVLPNNNGNTLYYLGRPWPSPSEAGTAQKTVFINSFMSSHIQPGGWSVWNANTITGNIFYGEYNSRYFNGSPVETANRVPWSFQLTASDAGNYTPAAMFGSWNPCGVLASGCAGAELPLAVSNFSVERGNSASTFSWNISWAKTGVLYTLYRSGNQLDYSPIYSTTATTDSAINFQFTDPAVPASGNRFHYYIVASLPGFAPHSSDTLVVSRTAMVNIDAPAALAFCGFNQVLGTPSPSQTYSLASSNLTAGLSITAPAPFEVSADGSTWFDHATPLVINAPAGTIATTQIRVRLNAAAVGNYSGDIIHTVNGLSNQAVAVTGRTTPLSSSVLLQAWVLTGNNLDSTAVRSPAVLPSATQLFNLNTTDGSLPAPAGSLPAYSNTYGQLFGANAAGNNWQAVGGTLRRHHYQEFTITASPGNSVRIDSITFFSNFYGTASGTKMSMVYSRNGFSAPSDSTEFSDGVGTAGNVLVLTASGSFNKSFPLAQNNTGPADYHALALNGNLGVTINAGETLTIRLYWACSSTGTPRFAQLKNVFVKGVIVNPVPLSLVYFTSVHMDNKVRLGWQTESERNVKQFEIERSYDGLLFTGIGNLVAMNVAGQHNYAYVDTKKQSGYIYYRLKVINVDGSFFYSTVSNVNIRPANSLKVIPNLVTSAVNVFHTKAGKGARLELYAFDGRKMQQQNVAKDAVQTNINADHLSPGAYNLVYVNNGVVEFVKFIKQ